MKKIIILFFCFILAANIGAQTNETINDIDGNLYHTVKIGGQVWMVENLKTTRYRNGDAIPNVISNSSWITATTGAWCYYNNDANNDTKYGKLYNWYAASDGRNLAPKGWHVATVDDWTTLVEYLGGTSVAGGKLKEAGTTNWASPNLNATNETGFRALPGGLRSYIDGVFWYGGTNGHFYTGSAESATVPWSYDVDYSHSAANKDRGNNAEGFSVRCMKDYGSVGDVTTYPFVPKVGKVYRIFSLGQFNGSTALTAIRKYLYKNSTGTVGYTETVDTTNNDMLWEITSVSDTAFTVKKFNENSYLNSAGSSSPTLSSTSQEFRIIYSATISNVAMFYFKTVSQRGLELGTTQYNVFFKYTFADRYRFKWCFQEVEKPNTPDTQAPTIPTGLSNSIPSPYSFTLIWNASTDNVGVTGYDVYKDGVFYNSTSTNNLNITGLTANIPYSMTVLAKDAAGNKSVVSTPLVISTSNIGKPGKPTGETHSCLSTAYQYTTTGATNATSYNWWVEPLSAGTITGTGTTASVTWNSTYNGYAYVVVQGIKSDCVGDTCALKVLINTASVPTAFSLADPINGAWSTSTPLFQWAASTNATTYNLYIDGVLKKANITSNSYQILSTEVITNGMHTWNIVASNGCTTESNETWSFRVDTTQPTAFSLASPADNSWTASLQPTLSWGASSDVNSGLAKYQLWIDGSLNKDNISATATSTTPTTNLTNGSHTWEIRAVDNVGNVRSSTQIWTVKIDNKPPIFQNAIVEKPYIAIYWSAYDYATGIQNGWAIQDVLGNIILGDTPNKTNYDYKKSVSLDPGTYTFTGYAHAGQGWNGGTFYIQNVFGSVGGTSYSVTGYGITANFKVGVNGNGLFYPSYPSTLSGTKFVVENKPKFIWTKAIDYGIDSIYYKLFIDNNLIADNLTDTCFAISTPLEYGFHSWCVKAFDALGNNAEVYNMHFCVDNVRPNAFSLTSPTNNQIVNLPTPNLTWQATTDSAGGSGMRKYQLLINGVINRDSIPITQTTVAPKNALAQGAYTWSINAYDNLGNVRQSTQTNTFYVDWENPTDFTLITPLDNSTLTIAKPVFKWHKSTDVGSGISKYELNITGQTPITILPSDTSKIITTNLPNGPYTWYVKAYDVAGGFTSSNTQTFTINASITGVEQTQMNNSIKVYPNPVGNEIVIESAKNERTNFEILNSIGQVIYKGILLDKTVVQTSSFNSGIYIVKLENGKTYEFKKILKK